MSAAHDEKSSPASSKLPPMTDTSAAMMLSLQGPDKVAGLEGLSDAKSDNLAKGRQIAAWVSNATSQMLPHGRGNISADVMKTNGYSYAAAEHIHANMHDINATQTTVIGSKLGNPVYGHYKKQYEGKNWFGIADTMLRTAFAIRQGAGNCHEFSTVALICLLKLKEKLGPEFTSVIADVSLKLTTQDGDQHVFLEMTLAGSGKQKLICDPWTQFCGTLDEAQKFNLLGHQADQMYANAKVLLLPEETSLVIKTLDPFLILKKCHEQDNKISGVMKMMVDWINTPVSDNLLEKGKEKFALVASNPNADHGNIHAAAKETISLSSQAEEQSAAAPSARLK
jgi:hypothetical protein